MFHKKQKLRKFKLFHETCFMKNDKTCYFWLLWCFMKHHKNILFLIQGAPWNTIKFQHKRTEMSTKDNISNWRCFRKHHKTYQVNTFELVREPFHIIFYFIFPAVNEIKNCIYSSIKKKLKEKKLFKLPQDSESTHTHTQHFEESSCNFLKYCHINILRMTCSRIDF